MKSLRTRRKGRHQPLNPTHLLPQEEKGKELSKTFRDKGTQNSPRQTVPIILDPGKALPREQSETVPLKALC
jgi:hypothetical protein